MKRLLLLLVITATLTSTAFANTRTHYLTDLKLYLDGLITDVKMGSGSIKLTTHDGDIDKLTIKTNVTIYGEYTETLTIEEMQRGKTMKYYADGSSPILIIEPDVQNIIPHAKVVAKLKVRTSPGSYSVYNVSIEKTKKGYWRFWRNYSSGSYTAIKTLSLTYKRSNNTVSEVDIN